MKYFHCQQILITFLVFTLLGCTHNNENTAASSSFVTFEADMSISYPVTRQGTVKDRYFNTDVADPYRWLEDDMSAETKAWVTAQNTVTFDYLEEIPFRSDIQRRLETLWNYEKLGAPFKEGSYTYFYKNTGLQNQYVLYRQAGDTEPEVFLDP
jgi:prolyl oligopeptidase